MVEDRALREVPFLLLWAVRCVEKALSLRTAHVVPGRGGEIVEVVDAEEGCGFRMCFSRHCSVQARQSKSARARVRENAP